MLLGLAALALRLLVLLIFLRVLSGWLPLRQIADPILATFRHILPRMGAIDLSPLLAIILLGEVANILDTLRAYAATNLPIPIALIAIAIVWQLLSALIIIALIIVAIRLALSVFHADPWHPMSMAIKEISAPIVQPFRALLSQPNPKVDSAAIVAFVAYLLLYFLAREAFAILAQAVDPNLVVI